MTDQFFTRSTGVAHPRHDEFFKYLHSSAHDFVGDELVFGLTASIHRVTVDEHVTFRSEDGRAHLPPLGWYITTEDDFGFVHAMAYDSMGDAVLDYSEISHHFDLRQEALDKEDAEDITPRHGSMNYEIEGEEAV